MNMTQSQQDKAGPFGGSKQLLFVAIAVAVIAVAGVLFLTLGGDAEGQLRADVPTFPVKQGPLTISVMASGSLRSGDADVIKNEVEGRTTILTLVEEGTFVQKGDLLVELDSSQMEQELIEDEIQMQRAEADLTTAQLNLELAEKQGESDVQTAEVQLELAILDLEKYAGANIGAALGVTPSADGRINVREYADRLASIESLTSLNLDDYRLEELGEYQQELMTAENQITTLTGDLGQQTVQLEGSRRLNEKGYITDTELETDRLREEEIRLSRDLAIARRDLLRRYTYRREMAQLQNAVAQAAFNLEKAEHQARASITDATAKLRAQELTHAREQERLDRTKRQLAATKVYATADGMVVHGTSSGERDRRVSQEPLDEGVEVRERQDLIRLVKGGKMVADVKIHESQIDKVRAGQPVLLTTDAVKDKTFRGRVQSVAMMAAAQDRWLNPDLRVYDTVIEFDDSTDELRPGMSVNAEIVVARYEDALYVPIQAVQRVNGEPTVYVLQNGEAVPRVVETGLDNLRFVHVTEGLEANEPVLLNPPVSAAERTADSASVLDREEERSREVGEMIGEVPEFNPDAPPRRGGGPAAAAGQAGQAGQGGFGEMTEEQRAAMRERFQNMSEEERSQMFQQFRGQGVGGVDWQNMSEEERAQFRQRRGAGGGGFGGRRGVVGGADGGDGGADAGGGAGN